MKFGINVLLAFMIIGSFLLAMALHEFAHALIASWLGDRTPRADGRQTLRLRSHIDSVGTLLCVILAFMPITALPVGLGWGKPVKSDPWKMRVGPNTGMLLVACAGLLFSLLIGLVTALILRFAAPFLNGDILVRVIQLLLVFASVNICMTIFNLLPIYPLDGYQILYTLLPSRQATQFARSAPYGPFIILALFFFLPFLATLSGVGDFPLFRLPSLILMGSLNLISLVLGYPLNMDILKFYFV